MELQGKTAVVTGAASGIGRALAIAFAREGAIVACADRDLAGADDVARQIGGKAWGVDVAQETEIASMIDAVEGTLGQIDLFCSNAGIFAPGGVETPTGDWQTMWDINVMSHVHAARHMVPRMTERGGGYFLNTASAAGLLNQIGSAPYGVTKHAAVGFAEWLAMTHGDDGIKVSVLCPQAVHTPMIENDTTGVASGDGVLSPEDVAQACVKGIQDETFLILPHPEVLGYMQNKAENYDRWIGGMRKLNRHFRTLLG
jgi:NAD(P)-dependent dehydrogenase (short-subunit alcohol dehydrogenase family)